MIRSGMMPILIHHTDKRLKPPAGELCDNPSIPAR
jgi:hypothetical protein